MADNFRGEQNTILNSRIPPEGSFPSSIPVPQWLNPTEPANSIHFDNAPTEKNVFFIFQCKSENHSDVDHPTYTNSIYPSSEIREPEMYLPVLERRQNPSWVI